MFSVKENKASSYKIFNSLGFGQFKLEKLLVAKSM